MAQKIVHRLAACRTELKEAFLGIARQEALAFEWFIPEEVNVTDALPIGYEDDKAF